MDRKKIGATLLVCAILASGLVAAGLVATNGIATDGSSDALSIDSGTSAKTLNVTVYANVQGQTVPIQGANVTVYEVNVVENDTVETITIEKIATTTTGVGGLAQIVLPEGEYTLVADYYGLRSVGILSNDTADNISMVLNYETSVHAYDRGVTDRIAQNDTAFTCNGGFGHSDLNGVSNQTSDNPVPAMNGTLASGSGNLSERGLQRRH